jgi:sodium/bile acid cotransporter 7
MHVQLRRWGVLAQAFVVKNFLVVGFAVALIFALSFPLPGAFMGAIEVGPEKIRVVEFINNIMVFLISGLSLKTSDVKASLYVWPIVYGLITINFITTLVAFVMIRLPFPTAAFSEALAIFSTVPTTLGAYCAYKRIWYMQL